MMQLDGEAIRKPAAAYVRMSTEHQRYSTENQRDAIDRYAREHGLEIVRTYSDAGKSGLSIDGRNALKQLIEDVQTGAAPFQVVLVYDVSRWGRFQDADESAYYEYLCKRAGLNVRYCAEQFENDGSPISTIVKGVKRAMAGEYSRELSAKVFAGQARLVELGFRQGGPSGYGLRRKLIDQAGQAKGILARGERKSLQTDRVILEPGPQDELQIIQEIFHNFTQLRKNEETIAVSLNARGVPGVYGNPWTRNTVHQVLTSEKYIGHNVWNRVSRKLKQARTRNDPKKWIRGSYTYQPIIGVGVFLRAQEIIAERSRHLSDEHLLGALRDLLAMHGTLSGLIINEAVDVPSRAAYAHRFGSLLRAYQLIGYTPDRDYRYIQINRHLRQLHPEVMDATILGIQALGGSVNAIRRDLLRINDEFSASIVICRCNETLGGSMRWKIRLDAGLMPDITVAVRLEPDNVKILDYYLLPSEIVGSRAMRLSNSNGIALDAFRFDSLEALFELAARVPLEEVA
jgi:DNA invertase Pin-like site-specific DNA recombinase